MQKNIIILIISLFIIACNNNSNECKTSAPLCIVLKDGTKFDIPQSNINSYYASISHIIMNSQKGLTDYTNTEKHTNTEKLYDALINAGFTTDHIGDKNTFIEKMRDENNRNKLYDYVSQYYNIGDKNTYLTRIASDYYQDATGSTPSNHNMSYTNTEKLYDALINYGYTTDNIGSKDTFIAGMSDHQTRKRFYDYIVSNGDFRIGDYAKYEERLASDFDNPTTTTYTKLDIHDLTYAYDRLEMTHNDKIVYATLWLIDNGYEFDVSIELIKHASKNTKHPKKQ